VIPNSYKLCYEVLDEIMNETFGINLIERKAVFSSFFKVIPNQKVEVNLPARARKSESPDNRGRTGNITRSVERQKNSHVSPATENKERFQGKVINKVIEEKIKKDYEELLETMQTTFRNMEE